MILDYEKQTNKQTITARTTDQMEYEKCMLVGGWVETAKVRDIGIPPTLPKFKCQHYHLGALNLRQVTYLWTSIRQH